MLFRGTNNFIVALTLAAWNGHESIIQLMLDGGAINCNEAMINVARTGHEAIVRLTLEKGAKNYNRALVHTQKEITIKILSLFFIVILHLSH